MPGNQRLIPFVCLFNVVCTNLNVMTSGSPRPKGADNSNRSMASDSLTGTQFNAKGVDVPLRRAGCLTP